MPDTSYHVVLNANSGTVLATGITGPSLQQMFAAHGMQAVVDDDTYASMDERIARAIASDAEVVVAAGGDGTITSLAHALVGTNKTLAILPLGTVNALARDLHLPMTVDQAVAALGDLQPRRIDVGEVNGRIFLHKVVIGVIPALAAGREYIRGRANIGASIGFLRYFFRRLTRAKRIAVSIDPVDGESRVERVQAIAIASNAYDQGLGMIFSRQKLDQGFLTLYVLKHLNVGDFFRLTSEMLLGRWHEDEALTIQKTEAVTVNSRKGMLKVMFDGDVQTLQTPLEFRIRPLALSILAPPDVASDALPPETAAEPAQEPEKMRAGA